MPTNQALILSHKEIIPLTINRMSVYLRSKIVEAVSVNQEIYYLFFFNNKYVAAMKTNKLRRHSFIEHSMKNGMTLPAPHPLITKLISSDHPYKLQNHNQIIKKVKSQFTPHEAAFVLTFFESFIPRKVLFQEIQEIFYQYRRNGQLLAGYGILRILLDFVPKNKWVHQMANDLSLKKYADLYQQFSKSLYEKDPIFAEKLLYSLREQQDCFDQLTASLEKDGCTIDVLTLHLQLLIKTPNTTNYHLLLQKLQTHFNEEEIGQILCHLSSELPQFKELHGDLIQRLLKLGKFEEATYLIDDSNVTLPPEVYEDLIQQIQEKPHSIHFEKLNKLFIPLALSQPHIAEKTLLSCIISLLKEHDIAYIQEWLQPIREKQASLHIFKSIDQIETLSNDPNKQLALGELYYQLMQYDRAIECFSWEMELNSSDPRPVQWLTKVYQKLNMKPEYEAYQQLLVSMTK